MAWSQLPDKEEIYINKHGTEFIFDYWDHEELGIDTDDEIKKVVAVYNCDNGNFEGSPKRTEIKKYIKDNGLKLKSRKIHKETEIRRLKIKGVKPDKMMLYSTEDQKHLCVIECYDKYPKFANFYFLEKDDNNKTINITSLHTETVKYVYDLLKNGNCHGKYFFKKELKNQYRKVIR